MRDYLEAEAEIREERVKSFNGCLMSHPRHESPRTVQKYLEHIYEKLGVETRMAGATLALGWGAGGQAVVKAEGDPRER